MATLGVESERPRPASETSGSAPAPSARHLNAPAPSRLFREV